jgi:transcription initiation factor TFIIE subunit alpha
MQSKLLKSIVVELAGIQAEQIIDILIDKNDVNEFLIAKRMKMTINQVRNILYKLSAEGLVSFTRKKDKRKGWYIYFWTLDTEKCLMKLEVELMKKIKDLEILLQNRMARRYYLCKSCNIEVGEESALEHDFSCQECAEVYQLADNDKPIKEITGRIKAKQRDLDVIKKELLGLREKEASRNKRAEKKKEKKSKGHKVKKSRVKSKKKIKKINKKKRRK